MAGIASDAQRDEHHRYCRQHISEPRAIASERANQRDGLAGVVVGAIVETDCASVSIGERIS
jgi:hypothetical protein